MFFYPDPEPIRHCFTDVSPSYLTDGVFFNGRSIGATHKCVAKQLSPIPRGPEALDDPVAPRAKVNPRTLENWTNSSKAWYVDNCGRNAKALHGMMGLLPKEKIDAYAGWKSKVSIFPRSEQYEYSYIKKTRLKNLRNDIEEEEEEGDSAAKFMEMETNPSVPTPAFEYTKTPIWWQDKIPNRIQCAVGFPDDYQIQRPDSTDHENTFIRQKQSLPNVPGSSGSVIYRNGKNRANNEIQESLQNKPDEVKVEIGINGEGEDPKDSNRICECRRYYRSHKKTLMCKTEDYDDLKKAEVDSAVEHDPRWHLWHEVCDVPRNYLDRKKAMLNLFRPYRHEINTWYSKNKPTKLLPMVIFEGKRPIPESHFSNL